MAATPVAVPARLVRARPSHGPSLSLTRRDRHGAVQRCISILTTHRRIAYTLSCCLENYLLSSYGLPYASSFKLYSIYLSIVIRGWPRVYVIELLT